MRGTTYVAAVGMLLLCAGPVTGQEGLPLGSPIPGMPLGQPVEEERGPEAFLPYQLGFSRVDGARQATDRRLRALFEEHGLRYPAEELFIRVFKHERELELWARNGGEGAFTLIREYRVCALPGQLGPKRKMGDVQVPEGFYFIDQFNPRSEYHLSLRVNYPNIADRMRRDDLSLGGDIFIHGGCATVGCVPIEDANMEEVYWLAVQATDAGQRLIPVHIFPARLHTANLRWLRDAFDPEPELMAFWERLSEGYEYFEQTQRVPWITVAENGEYAVPERPALAADSAGAPPVGALAADSLAADSTGTDTLAESGEEASSPPDTPRPATPDTARPVMPDTARPAAPDTVRPVMPDTARSAAPDTARPATPDTARSATPDTARPATPDTVPPATPDTVPAGAPVPSPYGEQIRP